MCIMEENPFKDIHTIKEFTKTIIYQVLDFKHDKIPNYPYFFKDFENNKQLNFGMHIGTAVTFIMMESQKHDIKPDIVHQAIREAAEDIHDDLKSRYQKLESDKSE